MNQLIIISFSHYCERARWALQRYEVPFEEKRYLPFLHAPAMLWATRGRRGGWDKAGSPLATPLLTGDGTYVQGSGAIVRWASDRHGDGELHPSPAVEQWEQRLHDGLGVWTRWLIYCHGLPDAKMVNAMASRTVGPFQATLFRGFRPVATLGLRRALNIRPERADRMADKVMAELDAIEAERSGPFLVEDRFTAADLSLATMLAPLTLPPEYGVPLPSPAEVPPAYAELNRRVRAHPVGHTALELYAEHRHIRTGSGPTSG